jgi:hypothetical protein
MRDYPPYAADTALSLYISALIEMAEREKEQAERFWRTHQNVYTERRLQWARNQVSAFKAAERYLGNWRKIVSRYIERSQLKQPNKTQEFQFDRLDSY